MNKKALVLILVAFFLFASVTILTKNITGPKNNPKSLPTQSPSITPASAESWKTGTTGNGTIFKYPATLPTQYILVQKWPPTIEVAIAKFTCASPIKKINNRGYCVGEDSQGAAGSIYTTYIYNTEINGQMVTARFTLQYKQCANYGEPQKSNCEKERKNFSSDTLVDSIIQTINI